MAGKCLLHCIGRQRVCDTWTHATSLALHCCWGVRLCWNPTSLLTSRLWPCEMAVKTRCSRRTRCVRAVPPWPCCFVLRVPHLIRPGPACAAALLLPLPALVGCFMAGPPCCQAAAAGSGWPGVTVVPLHPGELHAASRPLNRAFHLR